MNAPPASVAAQLVLRFPRTTAFRAADLLPNAAQDHAAAWLARPGEWPAGRLVLYGAAGSGKSHLLHAWAEHVGGAVLPEATRIWPHTPIAIDTIDAVPDEVALLHLVNAAAEARQPLLLAATTPPSCLPIRLPDLASRLRATIAVAIGPAPDAFLQLLLGRLLADRQLRLPAPLQAWLLTRLPRSPAALRAAVATLDAAALERGRSITRPLAAQVLGLDDAAGAFE